ncbi:hypothetical protein [Ashy storm petrel gyrovirus]|uniref:Uncharacterized protein n=1 Tax=Ashy storm petrel gyrovirus TaxID=2249930 RepID=A0A2Z4N437_9VIRU|nr:hypothetical protein [Ashy storm petrel gyrovirus]AWX63612.1 hypothetical protein [Ashy storm petrel gyrovirus]
MPCPSAYSAAIRLEEHFSTTPNTNATLPTGSETAQGPTGQFADAHRTGIILRLRNHRHKRLRRKLKDHQRALLSCPPDEEYYHLRKIALLENAIRYSTSILS